MDFNQLPPDQQANVVVLIIFGAIYYIFMGLFALLDLALRMGG
jgi:hypothetical protein